MVTAIILIKALRAKIGEVAEALVEVKGVTEVYSVAGQYDIVAIIRVKTNDEVAEVATQRLAAVDGIEKTETLIAFQAYSKHDLAAMFHIGF